MPFEKFGRSTSHMLSSKIRDERHNRVTIFSKLFCAFYYGLSNHVSRHWAAPLVALISAPKVGDSVARTRLGHRRMSRQYQVLDLIHRLATILTAPPTASVRGNRSRALVFLLQSLASKRSQVWTAIFVFSRARARGPRNRCCTTRVYKDAALLDWLPELLVKGPSLGARQINLLVWQDGAATQQECDSFAS